jgi:TetR/AcrR family transcriptional regulator, cholesterol catabolism regulator
MAKIKVISNGTKKEAITKKAAFLFRKKGFAATSMRELAESIGVEAPSLYNHIGSKAELLRDICFNTGRDFTEHLEKVSEESGSCKGKLEALIRFHIQTILLSYDEVYVSYHEWKQLPEPYRTNFLQSRRNYERKMISILEKGIKTHEFKNLNPQITVLTILSALRGVEFWQRNKKEVSIPELEDSIVEHLLTGLIK